MNFPIPTPLFIFEMANNHMGSVEHGLRIVQELREAVKGYPFQFAVKLQYRALDTLIHPDFQGRMDIKYVKRFSETRLSADEFRRLVDEIKACGFHAICTPFDEASVDLIEQHGFDAIKIASCSLTDWPLIERIAKASQPVIASTAAVGFEDIDKVVGFFVHRQKPLAVMHCVAEYPTPDDRLQLNQIHLLKRRYPELSIGYSTHERPDNFDPVKIAIGLGAKLFEKHVGVSSGGTALNAYSATPAQVRQWLESARQAFEICGVESERYPFSNQEMRDLHSLRRGAFVRNPIAKGQSVGLEDLFFAIPTVDGQLVANDFSKYTEFVAVDGIRANAPVLSTDVRRVDHRDKVYEIVQQVRKLIKKSRLPLPGQVDLEISHHYGIGRFSETGAILLNIVNREYCKKLIVMLPGQSHPAHFHKLKEETFHIQYGEMKLQLAAEEKNYKAGDLILVPRGVPHSFSTKNGVIFEEISSTHYVNDSFYVEEEINKNKHRKTLLTYWME